MFGGGLLCAASLAGLFFVRRPGPNRLDVAGYRWLPADGASRWAHDFANLGSLSVLLIVVAVLVVVGLTRDWVRAAVCAIAPIGAVIVVQQVAKPLVGRHIGAGGVSSYPSGTVTAVAACLPPPPSWSRLDCCAG